MAVEVRQLVVKSNVLQPEQPKANGCGESAEENKKAVIEECRRMVIDLLREMKER